MRTGKGAAPSQKQNRFYTNNDTGGNGGWPIALAVGDANTWCDSCPQRAKALGHPPVACCQHSRYLLGHHANNCRF